MNFIIIIICNHIITIIIFYHLRGAFKNLFFLIEIFSTRGRGNFCLLLITLDISLHYLENSILTY